MTTRGPLETVERLIAAINAGHDEEADLLCDDAITVTEPDGGVVSRRREKLRPLREARDSSG